ncbi:glycerophosphodiester phosphodiesterase [Salinicola rhizosphaerae]|uniref:Glycerophosphoryl diester phosphodiesterase n=1 Tax=Salinicola rhizosphaerae TaxID=1443141 RepID=A0ABQ3E060_9GAMM|nr:glycerophosphodiester phosphodiesterase [Salinicola rhizosphaerae]GHB21339.1 glycerophosphoryl diester phosphodiesterase [Salinicola rhizosphaerae]
MITKDVLTGYSTPRWLCALGIGMMLPLGVAQAATNASSQGSTHATSQGSTHASSQGSTMCTKIPIPCDAVIAHRGASYQAPESTRPAYLLARDLGADYLELDLQRTKDGKLVAVHDNTLGRNTNVAEIFPERADAPVSSFTLAELERLDAGSWFNAAYPERARDSYAGLKILTLDDVIDIAEGGDNHPGLYIETKVPEQFPGIEEDLREKLIARGWLGDDAGHWKPATGDAVKVADGAGRVMMQTFSKASLEALEKTMPDVPRVLLLWVGEGSIAPAPSQPQGDDESSADYYARQKVASPAAYEQWLDFAKAQGAIGVGPSTIQTDHDGAFSSQFSYMDLAEPWMVGMAHDDGLLVHPYTVDEPADFARYQQRGVDGFFTNRTEQLLEFLGHPKQDQDAILKQYGY